MQYAIITKNPAADRPHWHGECGIAFNSKANAKNAMLGQIAALRRAGDRLEGREWCIVPMDFNMADETRWQIVKRALGLLWWALTREGERT